MADADTALAHLGEATVVGRGLGAYVALLVAGGRPQQVRGAILRDGPGLAGGGSSSTSSFIPFVDQSAPAPPDPFALVELATDVRPPDYACIFARQAAAVLGAVAADLGVRARAAGVAGSGDRGARRRGHDAARGARVLRARRGLSAACA